MQILISTFAVLILQQLPVYAVYYDNALVGVPEVECMEDRMKLTFKTEQPFTGRIFVKGMIDKDQCVNSFIGNSKNNVNFQISNGECNMRRSRKLGPDAKGVEQSITVIISFHGTFITKNDRAYRCTCFYMEADRVVTSRFDVSMLPTTDLVDTARMPSCTYTVHRGTVDGQAVSFAIVGEPVFHVWHCESDMFAMLVHSCFVDDGNGQEKKQLIDEHGCAIEPSIVPDLVYNDGQSVAFSEVNVFKFADKPPRCGGTNHPSVVRNKQLATVARKHRSIRSTAENGTKTKSGNGNKTNSTHREILDHWQTMDLTAGKIMVFDLEEQAPGFQGSQRTNLDEMNLLLSKGHAHVCMNPGVMALLIVTVSLGVSILVGLITNFVRVSQRKVREPCK